MKTTRMSIPASKQMDTEKTQIEKESLLPFRSLRPQKSMVRVKSLKPRRMTQVRQIKVTETK